MIVLDASAVVELLFQSAIGKKVAELIFQPKSNLLAPELLSVEVVQTVRRFIKSKELSQTRAKEAFVDFRDLPITFYPHSLLLEKIWELKNNFTAYDATYLALAEELGASLLTCDSAFIRAEKVKIIYLKNS